jgi:enoyl-[acyl-carrier-protein] reductase (NADH)
MDEAQRFLANESLVPRYRGANSLLARHRLAILINTINLLTKTWAAEYGSKGVRVNAVSPRPTRTEVRMRWVRARTTPAQVPAGRPATAEEIAEAIVFLAADRSSFIHGAKLAVDGRRTAIGQQLNDPQMRALAIGGLSCFANGSR